MSLLRATRQAQNVMEAEFSFNFDDTMANTSGTVTDFKSVAAAVFDVINLPPGSNVIGGEAVVETAYATSTAATLKVGDSSNDARYSNSSTIDLKTEARTALTPTGFYNTNGLPVRITVTPTVAASTAGKVHVRVWYVQRGRGNEAV